MKKQLGILLLIVISLSLLSGCKSEQTTTETSVIEGGAEGAATSYPVPDYTIPQPTSNYPAPGEGGAIPDNASLMTVEIQSLTPNANDPAYVVAKVKVNATTPVEGMIEYNSNLAGTVIDINLATADAAILAVGDLRIIKVSFRADNWGGGYYGSEITNVQ
jgi:hypothetical protein